MGGLGKSWTFVLFFVPGPCNGLHVRNSTATLLENLTDDPIAF